MESAKVIKEGYLFKEGGVRHNIKKRWIVVDEAGLTYYPGNTPKELKKPLGKIASSEILSVCELGVRKKQDFCFEIATPSRNWVMWALDKESMESWMAALTQSKQAGRASRSQGPMEVPESGKKGLSLSNLLPSAKKEEEDIDYISSDDGDGFHEQPYN